MPQSLFLAAFELDNSNARYRRNWMPDFLSPDEGAN